MSQENLETLQRGAEAYNARDVEGVLAVLDPDVEWHDVFTMMLGGQATTVWGHRGVRALMRDQDEVFDSFHAEYSDVHDLGDQVVAVGMLRTRGKESGAETESPVGSVAEFKNGKITRLRTFLDPAEALEAVGLSG
jgi:ketosteroid isomerase-like protein